MARVKSSRTTVTSAIIDDTAESPSAVLVRAFLVVYHGQGDDGRGEMVPLPDGAAVTIGRMEDNVVAIDHERVSRHHARIRRRGASISIRDLGSRNGTRVNGEPVSGRKSLENGDEISIGPVSMVVGIIARRAQETSIGDAGELDRRLASELERAVRYHRPLGLAMIRLGGTEAAVAEAVDCLERILRRVDYLAEYGPGEFAVVLPEATREVTLAAANRWAQAVGAEGGDVEVRIGMAQCPEDGTEAGPLLSRVRSALRAARCGRAGPITDAPREEPPTPDNIVVAAPAMKRLFGLTRKVADTPITVLVLGETGVGKEIVARTIHEQSERAPKPFQALNCSALPENLLESEIFGHERGAFTGADRRKIGYFEAAAGGTIFLDEVGEMPLGVQVKLLRVLEQSSIIRVGGTKEVPIDARVVCATNRDLEREVKSGRFREDLFFRISAFTLVVPPLRDRRPEIIPLSNHFAHQFAGELGQRPPDISLEARAVLESYDWPGNVRELRNAIERAVVLQPHGSIRPEHLPERIVARAVEPKQSSPESPANRRTDIRSRTANLERDAVVAALDKCNGNQTRAAQELGISRWALIRMMRKHGLKKPPKGSR